MIRFKPRQTRIRGSTVLLVCLAMEMTAAVVTVIVAASGRQTRWIGNIAVTADQFVYLGDGKTYASGNVQLGDKLLLSGADDQVVFDSETLTGQGTLKLTDGNLELFSGPFTASGKAVASAHTAGFAKLIAEPRFGEIVGAHLVGRLALALGQEPAGERTVDADVRLPGGAGRGDLPAVQRQGAPPLDEGLDGIAFLAAGRSKLVRERVDVAPFRPATPEQIGGGREAVRSRHGPVVERPAAG